MSITLRVSRAQASALGAIKAVLTAHPGEHEVTIVAGRRSAERHLTLGPLWNCDGSPEVRARLSEFGDIIEADGRS